MSEEQEETFFPDPSFTQSVTDFDGFEDFTVVKKKGQKNQKPVTQTKSKNKKKKASAPPSSTNVPNTIIKNQLEYLVLDSNAIIRGHGYEFFSKAKHIVTIQEVLDEIRDQKARELLEKLPYSLEIMTPSPLAVREVSSYAMETGDFNILSNTDLRIVSLAYMLHKEQGGSIRPAPKRSSLDDPNDTKLNKIIKYVSTTPATGEESTVHQEDAEDSNEEGEEGEYFEEEQDQEEEQEDIEELAQEVEEVNLTPDDFPEFIPSSTSTAAPASVGNAWSKVASQVPTQVDEISPVLLDAHERAFIPVKVIEAKTTLEAYQEDKASKQRTVETNNGSAILASANKNYQNESKMMQEQDDGVGWVNVTNLHAHNSFEAFNSAAALIHSQDFNEKKKEAELKSQVLNASMDFFGGAGSHFLPPVEEKEVPAEEVAVGCFTSDFSMQNVMIQMGIPVVSSEGYVVHSARTWVLRCIGCYHVHTKDLSRLFCANCGGHTLSRVSASLDAQGKLRLHLKKNYHIDTRGTKFSLPAPGKQSRFTGELLLREDQLLSGIWRQKTVKVNKDVKSAFGEDVTSDLGIHINKLESNIKIGMGKGNVNARKGRERRGKAKK